MITEDRLIESWFAAAFGQQGTQQVGGLGPTTGRPVFSAPCHGKGTCAGVSNRRFGDAQGDDFLDPRAGVEHGGEERIVAAAVDCAAIDDAEDGLDLVDGDGVCRPVVELRRLRRRVPRELLRVLEGTPVRQIRRDPRRPEGVTAGRRWQPGGRGAARRGA